MNMSPKSKNITKEEWRLLGYHYKKSDTDKNWIITGSQFGLKEFSFQLDNYADNTENHDIGEHDHFGPYGYLTIMISSEKKIDDYGIHGSPKDILNLSGIIKKIAIDKNIGKSIILKEEYSNKSTYSIEFKIKEYGFDPATSD